MLTIAGRGFASRLIVGTGKYRSFQERRAPADDSEMLRLFGSSERAAAHGKKPQKSDAGCVSIPAAVSALFWAPDPVPRRAT